MKIYLHLALGGVLGARDIKGIEASIVAIGGLDDEHLWRRKQKRFSLFNGQTLNNAISFLSVTFFFHPPWSHTSGWW